MKSNSDPQSELKAIVAAVVTGDNEAAEKLKREFATGSNVLQLSDEPGLTPRQRMLLSLDDRTLQLVAPGSADKIRQLRCSKEASTASASSSPSAHGPKP